PTSTSRIIDPSGCCLTVLDGGVPPTSIPVSASNVSVLPMIQFGGPIASAHGSKLVASGQPQVLASPVGVSTIAPSPPMLPHVGPAFGVRHIPIAVSQRRPSGQPMPDAHDTSQS